MLSCFYKRLSKQGTREKQTLCVDTKETVPTISSGEDVVLTCFAPILCPSSGQMGEADRGLTGSGVQGEGPPKVQMEYSMVVATPSLPPMTLLLILPT